MGEQRNETALEVIDVEPRNFVPTLVMTPDKALAKYRAFGKGLGDGREES